jgi:hypothetical protein
LKGQQEEAQGKMKQALETNTAAADLEEQLGRIRSERTARQNKEIAEIAARSREQVATTNVEGRKAVESMRDATNREKIRVAEGKVAALKLSPVDKAAMDAEMYQAKRQLNVSTGFNQETMTAPTPEQIQMAHDAYDREVQDIISRYTTKQIGSAPPPAGLKAETPAPTSSGGSAWAAGLAAAKKAREAATKK